MDRQEAGITLRDRRTSLGLSFEDVARATLLRKSVLESLEAGGPPEPNGFFKSYARRYATYLELDGDEIVAAFAVSSIPIDTDNEVAPAQSSKPGRSITTVPVYRRKRSLVSTVLIVVVALATAIVLLSRDWPMMSPAPGEGQPGPSSTPSVPSDVTNPSVPATVSTPDTTPVLPAEIPMTLRFSPTTQRAWLEIVADGRVIFSGILRPGDSTQVTGYHVVVNFGNAMYTEVTANGASQGVASPDKTVMTIEYGSPAHAP